MYKIVQQILMFWTGQIRSLSAGAPRWLKNSLLVIVFVSLLAGTLAVVLFVPLALTLLALVFQGIIWPF